MNLDQCEPFMSLSPFFVSTLCASARDSKLIETVLLSLPKTVATSHCLVKNSHITMSLLQEYMGLKSFSSFLSHLVGQAGSCGCCRGKNFRMGDSSPLLRITSRFLAVDEGDTMTSSTVTDRSM